MPLLNSYVTWNNKGGVGKTTLTFHMATEYARSHPDQKVLVIDLCPQANVSMALLGSGSNTEKIQQLVSQKKTISFYLKAVTDGLPWAPQNFLTNVSEFNCQIPSNVELLCGDMHLELVARSLEQKRQVKPDVSGNPSDPWASITSCVRYFIEGWGPNVMGVTADNYNSGWVVFIDTNPSFSVYTEMALLAAQRLIIPINADDFSREALKTLFQLVYGIATNEVPLEFKLYEETMTFSYKAKQFNVRLPGIHLLIHNRATRYNLRSAQAFELSALSSFEVLKDAFLSDNATRSCFVPKFPQIKRITDSEIRQAYFEDMYDFHTVGIVSLHNGYPLAALANLSTYAPKYVSFQNGTVQLDKTQINSHLGCLQSLVAKL